MFFGLLLLKLFLKIDIYKKKQILHYQNIEFILVFNLIINK